MSNHIFADVIAKAAHITQLFKAPDRVLVLFGAYKHIRMSSFPLNSAKYGCSLDQNDWWNS